MLLGVDVGGTFTDAVVFDGTNLHTAKSPSTPDDVSRGVLAAVDAVLERAGAEPGDVEVFAHGMTVGTNRPDRGGGARTALVATEGFTDVLEVARQNRPDLYRLCAPKPVALVPRDLRFGARGRIGPRGEIDPLPEGEADRIVGAIRDTRRRVGRRMPAVLLPRPEARGGDRRAAARGAGRRARLGLPRGPAAVPRVRARLDHRRRRLPLPPARPLPRPADAVVRRARAARAADHEVLRRRGTGRRGRARGRLERAVRARRRGRGRGASGSPLR